jgi:ADP-heptose:LPS heptosyltransferase
VAVSSAGHRVGQLPHPDAPHILVLRALGLGDLLTGFPALRGLRRAYPDAHIVLAAPERFSGLAMLSGAIDGLDPTPGLGRLHPRRRVPDLAVNLHGSDPESIADLIALRPKAMFSHRHRDYPHVQGPPWRAELHEVDRWCALLHWYGIACNPEDLAITRPPGYPDRSGVVVIHPGATTAARRWPVDRFATVAAALRADGYEVVLTGDRNEIDLARAVAEQAGLPESAVVAGTLGLLGLVAMISDCRLLICGDTGIRHIATATGAPSVLLFGPTPPKLGGPRGPAAYVALWAGDSGDPHGDEPQRGLLSISPQWVLDAVGGVLTVQI